PIHSTRSQLTFLFFSSRRRHTRFSRDWSSDVCSSDLPVERHHVSAVDLVVWPELGHGPDGRPPHTGHAFDPTVPTYPSRCPPMHTGVDRWKLVSYSVSTRCGGRLMTDGRPEA